MSSSVIAISPFDAQKLLTSAGVDYPGVIKPGKLEQIMLEMKSDIEGMGTQGFIRKAMFNTTSDEYIWAHTTAQGIIWLWGQQDANTREELLNSPKPAWQNHRLSPSPDNDYDLYGTIPSVSPPNSEAYPAPGSSSFPAVSVPASSATYSPFSFGSSPGSTPPTAATAANPFSLAPGFGSVSVPTTPQASSSSKDGGYRKRRTRKTRRKSSRRGRSRSRSRSHQIRRKKTHHRRHRR